MHSATLQSSDTVRLVTEKASGQQKPVSYHQKFSFKTSEARKSGNWLKQAHLKKAMKTFGDSQTV